MVQQEDVLYQQLEKLVHYLGYLETLQAKCCSLSFVQSACILSIGKTQDLSVNGLADALRLDKSTASRHVTNLVDSGYVQRTESQEDRRYFVLSLTDQGKTAYQSIQNVTKHYYETLFGKMHTDDKEKLQEGLHALLTAIQTSDCC